MTKLKKNVLDAVAKLGMRSAIKGAGAASSYGYHQPKEPEALKKLKK